MSDAPLYDPPGVPQAYVEALKVLPLAALADYCDAVRRADQLERAITLAVARLEPYAEIHAYIAMIVDTLLADLQEE